MEEELGETLTKLGPQKNSVQHQRHHRRVIPTFMPNRPVPVNAMIMTSIDPDADVEPHAQTMDHVRERQPLSSANAASDGQPADR